MNRLIAIVLLIVCNGCSKPGETTTPRRTDNPSEVAVDTGSTVVPLSTFTLGIAHALPVRNTPHAVPNVPTVRSFLVNVPNVSASDLKLYWVRDLDLIFSNNQSPIAADVKQRDSGFEVAPPAVQEKGGYLMLVISPAKGGLNRYYAVALHS